MNTEATRTTKNEAQTTGVRLRNAREQLDSASRLSLSDFA